MKLLLVTVKFQFSFHYLFLLSGQLFLSVSFFYFLTALYCHHNYSHYHYHRYWAFPFALTFLWEACSGLFKISTADLTVCSHSTLCRPCHNTHHQSVITIDFLFACFFSTKRILWNIHPCSTYPSSSHSLFSVCVLSQLHLFFSLDW